MYIKHTPDYYPCGNCTRDLKVSEYSSYRRPDVKAQRSDVHVHYSPNYYPFTLMCTCGHYTVVIDVKPNRTKSIEGNMMGRAKPVKIAGRLFEKQGDAVSYFTEQKDERLTSGLIKEGELYDALKDVYERYCDNSPGYELNGRLITAFSVAYEKRQNNGVWATYACYKVHFSNDEIRPFSIAKAVRSVASNP